MHSRILDKVRGIAFCWRSPRLCWRTWGVQTWCRQLDLEFRQRFAQGGLRWYRPRVRAQGEGRVPARDVLGEEFSADEFGFLAAH